MPGSSATKMVVSTLVDEPHKLNRPKFQKRLHNSTTTKKLKQSDLKPGPISSPPKKRSPSNQSGSSQDGSSIFSSRSTRAHGTSSISSWSSLYSDDIRSTIYAESDCTSNDSNSTNVVEEPSELPIYSDSKSLPGLGERDELKKFDKTAIEPSGYDLPCEFHYLNCRERFHPHDFENWIWHSMSHFGGKSPPSKVSCTLCPALAKIFESRHGPYYSWRERMFHIGNHFQNGAREKDMRRDPMVLAHLGHLGLVSEDLYAQALLQIPHVTKRLGSGVSVPSKFSKDRSPDEDMSTCATAQQQEEPELPHGDCDYKFLGREESGKLCSCVGFILDAAKLNSFCVCGHRATFHTQEKSLETKATEADNKREAELDKCQEPRKANEISKGKFCEVESLETDDSDSEGAVQLTEPLQIAQPLTQHSVAELRDEAASAPEISVDAIFTTAEGIENSRTITVELPRERVLTSIPNMRTLRTQTKAPDSNFLKYDSSSESTAETYRSSTSASSLSSSVSSADDTDWDEDSDTEVLVSTRARLHDTTTAGLILSPSQLSTVERQMDQLWMLLNNELSSRAAHSGENLSSSTPPPAPGVIRASQPQKGSQGIKRQRSNQEESNADDDDDGKGSKRPSKSPGSSNTEEIGHRFACPYRKHDPQKYSVQDWKICALNHHKTVARVKAHLYRYHLIYQCQRCKEIFETDDELDTHVLRVSACELQEGEPVDGITMKMKQQIQSRKKAHPNQTEAEKWQQIYRMLFPEERQSAPNPYFNPVVDQGDNNQQSGDAGSVSSHEEYLRHEVPRILRRLLEEAVQAQAEPNKELTHDQLIVIAERAQNLAFQNYRKSTSNESITETLSSVEQEAPYSSINSPAVNREPPSQYDASTSSSSPQVIPGSTSNILDSNSDAKNSTPTPVHDAGSVSSLNGAVSEDYHLPLAAPPTPSMHSSLATQTMITPDVINENDVNDEIESGPTKFSHVLPQNHEKGSSNVPATSSPTTSSTDNEIAINDSRHLQVEDPPAPDAESQLYDGLWEYDFGVTFDSETA